MSEIDKALGLEENSTEEVAKVDEVKPNPVQYVNGVGDNSAAESIITIVAYIMLIFGCIGSIIYGVELADSYMTDDIALPVVIGGVCLSVVTWAFLMVVANVSNNIRQIKHELRRMNGNK